MRIFLGETGVARRDSADPNAPPGADVSQATRWEDRWDEILEENEKRARRHAARLDDGHDVEVEEEGWWDGGLDDERAPRPAPPLVVELEKEDEVVEGLPADARDPWDPRRQAKRVVETARREKRLRDTERLFLDKAKAWERDEPPKDVLRVPGVECLPPPAPDVWGEYAELFLSYTWAEPDAPRYQVVLPTRPRILGRTKK